MMMMMMMMMTMNVRLYTLFSRKCPFTGRPKKGVPRLVPTNLDIFETGVFFYPDSLGTEGRLV